LKASVNFVFPRDRTRTIDAIGDIGHGSGASRQAIKRWIAEHYPDLAASDKFETNFRAAVKNLVGDGAFVQPRGPSGKIKKVSRCNSLIDIQLVIHKIQAGKSAAAKSGSLSPVASAKITKRRTGLLKQPEQASRSSHTTKVSHAKIL
jgi:hypothetical protein